MRVLAAIAICLLAPQAFAGDSPPLTRFIGEYAKANDFNGSILVRRGDSTLYSGCFGLANFQHHVPNGPATRYRIASITKAFTAVLVLQLAEAGKVDLDAHIHTYLPGYGGAGSERVTLRQLLNHTSGIENFDRVTSAADAIAHGLPAYQLPHDTGALLSEYASGKLVSEPGSRFSYNNGDYVILGKIIEAVTRADFETVLARRILEPLDMHGTGMAHQADIIDDLADTYFRRDDLARLAPDLPAYPENWYAAGGMYSTTGDLARFADALFDGRLLKPATLKRMLQPGLDDYGYGVWSYSAEIGGRKHRVVKRPGQIMGAQSQLYRILDARVTVIILANTGTTNLDEFVAEIGKRALN